MRKIYISRSVSFAVFAVILLLSINSFAIRVAPVTSIPTKTVCCNTTVVIPIVVTGFTNISALSLRIDFNSAAMTYVPGSAVWNPILTGALPNVLPGKILLVWSDVTARTLAPTDTIVKLTFNFLCTPTTLVFNNTSNGGGDCEYADENGDAMTDVPTATYYINGAVNLGTVGSTGTITGPASVCAGATGVVYSTTAVTNATNYTWSVPAGGSIVSSTTSPPSITVNYSNVATSGNVTVQPASPCGPGTIATYAVTVNPLPAAVAGVNRAICLNASTTLGASAVAGSTYIWSGSPTTYTSTLANPTVTPLSSNTYTVAETVTATGCSNSNSVVVTVNPNASISLTSLPGTTSQSVCINTPISNITYSVGGGGTGAGVIGLPAGVTGVYNAGVFTISGTPTAAGTFTYTITTTGTCIQTTTIGTITVNPNATSTLTSAVGTNAQTVCVNSPIINITYAIGGGGTGAGVSGLPAGITGVYNAGVFTISGTPAVTGTFPYVITTTGTCLQTTSAGTITVLPNATSTLTSAGGTNAQTVCINTVIVNITYSVGGGGTGAGVTGLPAGVSGVYNAGVFTISGTPTATGTYNYTVTTTGTCVQATSTGIITVKPNAAITLTSAAGTTAQTVCINTAITNITYSISGGGTGAGVSGLPPGVTGVFNAGVFTISGTPTTVGTYPFIVTTTGTCVQATSSGTITVTPNATSTLTSAAGTTAQTVCINTPITNITYSVGGGGTGAGVIGLPPGVTGVFNAGVFTISGIPTTVGTYPYILTTTGTCVQATSSGTITVTPNATSTLTSAAGTTSQSVCINTPITNITYSVGGGGTGAGATGLPAGVTGVYNAGIFTISGTPTVTGTFSYTVTTTGTCVQATSTGTIIVNPNASITLTSAAGTTNQSVCINTPIASITYSVGGGGSGASVSGLPAGVTGIYNAGVFTISGTPSVSGTFNYTVTTSGTCVQTTATGTIMVNPNATITLTSAAGTNAQSVCINTPITNITYSIGGGGTSGGVTGLPAGVTGVYSGGVFTISGTPTVAGTFPYTVTTTGICVQTTANGTITVNPNANITLTSAAGTNVQSRCLNAPITNITYAVGGGGTSASVTGLPTGVTGVYSAGVFTISGTPSVVGTFPYTVTTAGTCVQTTATGTITVYALPVPTITGPATVCATCVNNVYTTEAGMTGYNWTVSAGNTISLGAGTYSVTVCWNTPGAQTISVNYTNGNSCTAATATVKNVTVNALPIPTISGPATACAVSTGNVYVTTSGLTGYIWDIPTGGGTIMSGQGTYSVTVTWSVQGAQTIRVNYNNANGCAAATPTAFPVTVNNAVTPIVTGPVTACNGSTGNVYSTTAGMTNYIWQITPAGSYTITAGGTATSNTVTITWNTIGSQTVCVDYTNGVCTAPTPGGCLPVAVTAIPTPTITGPSAVCVNSTNNVYITQSGMTGYSWTLSSGGSITSGASTNTIAVTWSTTGNKTVCVNYINANGCTALAAGCYNVTVNALPAPTITGAATACAGTSVVYTTQPGMTNYVWTVSAGGIVTSGGTSISSTITVTWTTPGLNAVTVNYTNANGCTAATAVSFPVTINPTPTPTIGSNNTPCVGSTGNQYYTQSGMTGYIWVVSTGGNIASGQGTNAIIVTWTGVGAQWVSVNYANANGCMAPSASVYNLFVNPLPNAAGAITGTATLCAGTNGIAYSCAEITNATSYTWTLPAGATIATGAGTKSITVNFSASAVSGNIIVAGTNSCGNGTASPAFAVTVNPLPAAAGTIIGPASVCVGATGVAYSVPTIANATTYVWTVPAGATITSGATTRNIVVTYGPTAGTGVITVKGTNSCGDGVVSPNLNVTMNAIPSSPVVTVAGNVLTSSATTGNQWYYEGNPIAGATNQTYTVIHNTGYYWCVVTTSGCSSPVSNKVWVVVTGQQDLQGTNFSVYPVPNDGRFNVSITTPSQENFSIEVFNQLGAKIYELGNVQVNGTFEKQIDLRPVANGVYSVVFLNGEHKVVKKVLVNK